MKNWNFRINLFELHMETTSKLIPMFFFFSDKTLISGYIMHFLDFLECFFKIL